MRPRLDLVKLDYVTAAVLTIALVLETWLGGNAEGHRIAVTISGLFLTGAVAFRRRYPTTVGVGAGVVASVMQGWWPSSEVTVGIAWICCVYGLAVWSTSRRFWLGLAAIVVVEVGTTAATGGTAHDAGPFIIISTVALVLVHLVVGQRDRRAEMAERERDLAAREAVIDERARIARELHDVIAHNVSMMVVQAGAERRMLDDEQHATREVLETVEQIGRGALTEMRRLVGMLRDDGDDPLTPQPALDDLPRLVNQIREAGLPVELHVEGERRDLPAGIELSAYRIVQEALTNALKYAGDAHATVRVQYASDSLELEISDDGVGGEARAPSGGHGLVGMRERVALYGGRLDAGRRPSGGFAVRVLLPLR